ncbi:MAG: hypothetical protein Q7J31_00005 [Syntrophales bacterium]|nr:hypothetical protein [Syntrophales bacterium]
MNDFWNNLSRRQQYAMSIGCAVVLALLLAQFLLFPFLEAKKTVNRAIKSNEKILGEMALLSAEYRGLKQHGEGIQRALARRSSDFTLFSHLERVAGEAGVKANIKYINASNPSSASGPYEELPVEIKLEKITLKQLTDFFYILESPQDLIKIKKLVVSKMKESPEYLAAQIQAVTLQLMKAGGP